MLLWAYAMDQKKQSIFQPKVHKMLAIEVYSSSVDLAENVELSLFIDIEREINNPFIKRMSEACPEVYEKMKSRTAKYCMLTIAPTGSVSICTQTTSGIEPVFMVSYKRRRKVNPNDKNVDVTFVDEVGDSWEEYNVFHPKFVEWLKHKGYDPEVVND